MGESDFLDKYWKFSTINTDQNPLKIFNFFSKNAYLTPWKKTSSNLHESQELSGPLPKKCTNASFSCSLECPLYTGLTVESFSYTAI